RLGEALGIDPRYTGSLTLGGGTAGSILHLAAIAVNAGMADYVACVFADAAATGGSRFSRASGWGDSYAIWGFMSACANSAISASRHMALYGTTSRHLGEVAVACRKHASLNPHAVMRKPITIEDHQSSRWIVKPLHLLDCCLISDGGVCIIVTTAERAAYRMAGVGARDIDVAQFYDNFSISVILWLEHAGFCKPGEGGAFVEGGRIQLGGELPVNTAGGNLSESYMEGWLHVVEGVRQLRGECGVRQVPGAELCLVTGRGMSLNCANATVLGKG
ncbi:MAG: thiolase family protein, partial [Betaproteobacteria bacterium]|nr:thiolase family protein [Betaproteobacteria bacterium]